MILGLSHNLSVIDKRIASQLHKKQIEGTLLAERVAYNFDQIIDKAVNQVIRKVSPAVRGSLSESNRNQAAGLLGTIGSKVNGSYLKDAVRIAHWSHNESVSIYAKNIPRKWFRRIAPEVVMVGERIAIGPGIDPDTIKEPVWEKKLTDKEWENLLKEVLFDSPTEEQVLQIINQPIAGKETSQRLNDLSRLTDDPHRVVDDLAKGLSSGENLTEISRRLEKQVQGVKSSARRIARTESLRVIDQMNRQTLEPLQDLLSGMQVLASLDQNTRPHHAHRHGTIYYYDTSKKPSIDELPDLPDEPNCRCWSSPVMNPPEGFEKDPALRAEFANNDGDSIPDPGVYTQWFDKADLPARKLAVGSKRYREIEKSLNGERQPEWTDFIDKDGRLLPIQSIRNEDDVIRSKRKQLVQQSIDKRADLVNQVASRGFVSSFSPKKEPKKKLPKKVIKKEKPVPPDPTAFRLAKTTREAEEIARELNLADHVDHGKLGVDVANIMNQQVHELITKYPSIRSELKFIGSIQSKNRYGVNEALKEWEKENHDYLSAFPDETVKKLKARAKRILTKNLNAKTPSSALAVARRQVKGNTNNNRMAGISFNEKYGLKSKVEQTNETLKRMVAANANPVGGDSLKYIIDHELGHVIDYHLGLVNNSGYGFKDHVLEEWRKNKTVDDIRKNVCKYATDNTHELVAESWGEFQNSSQPREFSKTISQRLQDLLEQKKQGVSKK